jgi:hypothetical protein
LRRGQLSSKEALPVVSTVPCLRRRCPFITARDDVARSKRSPRERDGVVTREARPCSDPQRRSVLRRAPGWMSPVARCSRSKYWSCQHRATRSRGPGACGLTARWPFSAPDRATSRRPCVNYGISTPLFTAVPDRLWSRKRGSEPMLYGISSPPKLRRARGWKKMSFSERLEEHEARPRRRPGAKTHARAGLR